MSVKSFVPPAVQFAALVPAAFLPTIVDHLFDTSSDVGNIELPRAAPVQPAYLNSAASVGKLRGGVVRLGHLMAPHGPSVRHWGTHTIRVTRPATNT